MTVPSIGTEPQRILLLAALSLLIPSTWMLFFGWQPSELIAQGDYLDLGLIHNRELALVGGDWEKMLYWPGLGGGVKIHDVVGSLPINELLAYLQINLTTISNVLVMAVQLAFAYLCVTASMALSLLLNENNLKTPSDIASKIVSAPTILLGLMFAFLPFLAWRLALGHEIIVIGLFVLLAFTVLFLGEINQNRSIVSTLVCILSLCHVFQSASFQLALYSVIFGGPILIGIASMPTGYSITDRAKWFVFPVLVFLAALLLSAPKLYGMLLNALGDESSRASGLNVVYSYTTATWADWLSSLTWTAAFMPEERVVGLRHEINYPLGPIALALLLAPFSPRLLKLAMGLAVSLLMALILSVNITPWSTSMINVIPMLESFRVPARAILPFIVMTSILGSSALLYRLTSTTDEKASRLAYYFGALLVVIAFGFAPAWLNEPLLIIALIALFFFKSKTSGPAFILVIAMFTGGAISAFKDRTSPPLEDSFTAAHSASLRQSILEQAPELAFPLNRVYTQLIDPHLDLNSHFFWGVSSLTSYWFPLERYSTLVMALEGLPYRPTHSLFHNQVGNQGFDTLNRLFNVRWELTNDASGYQVSALGAPFGAVWLSSTTAKYPDWFELATGLKQERDRDKLLLLSSDKKTEGIGTTEEKCEIIQPATISPSDFPYRVSLSVNGECFLTLAMNYTETLSVTNQNGEALTSFPAYGTLLGVVVDSETSMVSIEPQVTRLPGASWIFFCGLVFAAFALTLAGNKKEPV